MQNKIVSAQEAVSKIKDNDVITSSGFYMAMFPIEVFKALEERFLKTGHPKNLTIVHAAGQGDYKDGGLSQCGYEGLVKRVIGAHFGETGKLKRLIMENKVEAYNFPQGVISQAFRFLASRKPGVITNVGLETFVDPRVTGGKLNDVTKEDLVKLIEIDGQEYLHYQFPKVDVAILRATTADPKGNATTEKESNLLEILPQAQAAKANKGIVIVQVERIAEYGTLNPQNVRIPGIYVDYIVVAKPENHWQTLGYQYNPAYSGEIRVPAKNIDPLPMSIKKVIARRAARELFPFAIVNLGIGIPEGVASVANEEGISDALTLTVESGVIGGVPAWEEDFGAASNCDAIIEQPYQFDFYDGGGLDITFLGLAEVDHNCNVNVSKFAGDIPGVGGFINISQNTPRVVFCGAFTASGLEVEIKDGGIRIIKEGKIKKFRNQVQHLTFSGNYARKTNQYVLVITERAVFKLEKEGLTLTEIAPGVDLEKDILGNMEFRPLISKKLKVMDSVLFSEKKLGLYERFLEIINSKSKGERWK